MTDVCLSVVKLFSNRYSCYSFCPILTKIGAHDLCVNMNKLWNRFSKFCVKNFCPIFKFLCKQRCCEASRPLLVNLIYTLCPKKHFFFYFTNNSSSSSFLACNSRLRSAIHRHYPPQRAVLCQICCFWERKVVVFQILLDGAEPRDVGTT